MSERSQNDQLISIGLKEIGGEEPGSSLGSRAP